MACGLSGSTQASSMAEIQQLSDNLHSLNIIEQAQTGSPSSSLADSPDHCDYNAEGDAAQSQWREFHSSMDEKARGHPYPEYLYRAHTFKGKCSDTFGSDLHLQLEYDAKEQMFMPIGDLVDTFTVEDLFRQLNLHLGKTCINSQSKRDGKQPFLSPLVSLSGDFRWTKQRICSVGRRTSKDQIPGLAIFETSMINPTGVHFSDSSVHISSKLRRWAGNADEYVCWSLIPREALIAFPPLPDLIEGFNGGEEAFLTKGFVESNYLGDFGRLPRLHISLSEYADITSKFVRKIVTHVSYLKAAKQLCIHMEGVLLNPYEWGYRVDTYI
ncbi:hypothetical protein HDV63DRAFT_416817 [Trichoderma sp. SZMC 28014]